MRGLNCDLAQGFLFAEPVPGRQMQELLAAKGITAKPPADTQAA
jgi:EAL domain-containing protein (putative c-di-GMP-specific phosphodiesterase class I)